MKEKLTVREAAKQRKGLDGPDAEALEGALQQVEKENVDLKSDRDSEERWANQYFEDWKKLNKENDTLKKLVKELGASSLEAVKTFGQSNKDLKETYDEENHSLRRQVKVLREHLTMFQFKGMWTGDDNDLPPGCSPGMYWWEFAYEGIEKADAIKEEGN